MVFSLGNAFSRVADLLFTGSIKKHFCLHVKTQSYNPETNERIQCYPPRKFILLFGDYALGAGTTEGWTSSLWNCKISSAVRHRCGISKNRGTKAATTVTGRSGRARNLWYPKCGLHGYGFDTQQTYMFYNNTRCFVKTQSYNHSNTNERIQCYPPRIILLFGDCALGAGTTEGWKLYETFVNLFQSHCNFTFSLIFPGRLFFHFFPFWNKKTIRFLIPLLKNFELCELENRAQSLIQKFANTIINTDRVNLLSLTIRTGTPIAQTNKTRFKNARYNSKPLRTQRSKINVAKKMNEAS